MKQSYSGKKIECQIINKTTKKRAVLKTMQPCFPAWLGKDEAFILDDQLSSCK